MTYQQSDVDKENTIQRLAVSQASSHADEACTPVMRNDQVSRDRRVATATDLVATWNDSPTLGNTPRSAELVHNFDRG